MKLGVAWGGEGPPGLGEGWRLLPSSGARRVWTEELRADSDLCCVSKDKAKVGVWGPPGKLCDSPEVTVAQTGVVAMSGGCILDSSEVEPTGLPWDWV